MIHSLFHRNPNPPNLHNGFLRALPRQTTIRPRSVWLYFTVRENFELTCNLPGAYKSLTNLTLPDSSSPDYISTVLYQARAYIALNDPSSAVKIIPSDSENVAVKAVAALARYVGAADQSEKDSVLEELRDLSVEIESEDIEGSDRDKALVRVLAGTAFARAGEIEEALETLGTDTEDLEAYVAVQVTCHRLFTFQYQCSCRCTDISFYQSPRPCQEGVRTLQALGRGRSSSTAHRVYNRTSHWQRRLFQYKFVLHRTARQPFPVLTSHSYCPGGDTYLTE